jgi:tetratricopeptide (TPR) repeat protein
MGNDNSEIVKLTERIAKDPKSKLFVSLAEEYKKAGDGEMAINVLREGLKNNPGYVTAKSFLGKLLFETGDLAGAQTEFEEVVKAIPDNRMAQRKLGDIYVLQNRISDALSHYKLVLSMNPRDEEMVSLVSDIEAGHDIKSKIVGSTLLKPEETLNKKQSAAASPESAMAKKQQVPSAAKAGAAQSELIKGVGEDEEEAEEVLFVEPLDDDLSGSLEDALSTENLGFVEEPEPEKQDGGIASFERQEPITLEQEAGAIQGLREDEQWLEGSESTVSGEVDKKADDFTTDTLAELYITQGFFEKAIEIYDRLLADNPDSKGLKDKLDKVRAMAADSAPVSESGDDQVFTAPAHEFIPEHVPDISGEGVPSGVDESFLSSPADQEIDLSHENTWGSPPSPAEDIPQDVSSGQTPETQAALDTGFEPVEYVPPDAVPRESKGQAEKEIDLKGSDDTIPAIRKSAATGRKKTIDRLENWLQQIMKEK